MEVQYIYIKILNILILLTVDSTRIKHINLLVQSIFGKIQLTKVQTIAPSIKTKLASVVGPYI
jgi:hypothetical protein